MAKALFFLPPLLAMCAEKCSWDALISLFCFVYVVFYD